MSFPSILRRWFALTPAGKRKPTALDRGELAESKRRLEGIVDSAIDAIITVDEGQAIVLFNPAAEAMFGVKAEEVLGEPITRLIPERFRAAHAEHIRRFREAGVTNRRIGSLGAISGLRASGEEFPIEASISKVQVGGEQLATVILRDITERKSIEDALRESRRRMEGIVESAMDAIITVDEQHRIVLFNPAAERMFGVTVAEALGEPIARFIPERHRAHHERHIHRFRDTGVTNRTMGSLGAISGLRSNGEEFPIEASISQVEVGGEQLSTVILRDITERRANEEARLLLAREVDHRAKNAMAVAQALVTLTKAPTMEDFAAVVRGRIASLARAHSLLSETRWKGADLGRVAADELMACAKPNQVKITGPTITLEADAVQPLALLLHELATNATKHGALKWETGLVQLDWTVIGDEGLRFRWTESGGASVTEPIAKGFGTTLLNEVSTRQLGGSIRFDWRAEGLEVVILIPKKTFQTERNGRSPASAERQNLAPSHPEGAATGRILVVEDEVILAMELGNELTRFGWKVIGPALTLESALMLARETPRLSGAVLDVNLQGRPVYAVAEVLKARGVPFVFCTGYEVADPEGRYSDSTVLRKPVNVPALQHELARSVAQSPDAA